MPQARMHDGSANCFYTVEGLALQAVDRIHTQWRSKDGLRHYVGRRNMGRTTALARATGSRALGLSTTPGKEE